MRQHIKLDMTTQLQMLRALGVPGADTVTSSPPAYALQWLVDNVWSPPQQTGKVCSRHCAACYVTHSLVSSSPVQRQWSGFVTTDGVNAAMAFEVPMTKQAKTRARAKGKGKVKGKGKTTKGLKRPRSPTQPSHFQGPDRVPPPPTTSVGPPPADAVVAGCDPGKVTPVHVGTVVPTAQGLQRGLAVRVGPRQVVGTPIPRSWLARGDDAVEERGMRCLPLLAPSHTFSQACAFAHSVVRFSTVTCLPR